MSFYGFSSISWLTVSKFTNRNLSDLDKMLLETTIQYTVYSPFKRIDFLIELNLVVLNPKPQCEKFHRET